MEGYNTGQPTYSNDVLSEQIRRIERELKDFKRDSKTEFKEMEQEIEYARRLADSTDNSMKYIKEAVGKMEVMMTGFINVVSSQNEKIDEFINSDKRRDSKKEFAISVVQVVSGIVLALIGFWATGQI